MASSKVTVLGAGYSGLTTAAELTLRGFKVDVIASDLGMYVCKIFLGSPLKQKKVNIKNNQSTLKEAIF